MNWTLLIDRPVKKQLLKIPRNDSNRITSAIKELVVNPYAGDIEKMSGEKDTWRRRVGSYRFFYEIYTSRGIIFVFDLKRRASNTY